MLTEAQIKKYIELHKEQYGKDISREEALEQSAKLISLVQLIYKPLSNDEYENLQKRRRDK